MWSTLKTLLEVEKLSALQAWMVFKRHSLASTFKALLHVFNEYQ